MSIKFEEVYQNQKNTVYNYLYYMTQDVSLTEDLCQETFLKVFLNLRKFRKDASEKTWCLVIARNTFLSYTRKKQPLLAEGREPDDLPDSGKNPEVLIAQREEQRFIRELIFGLKEEYRTALLLRDLEGFSYAEIGNILGISESLVKIRIHRARMRYRELYQVQANKDGR